jgi:hypothetical protein
MLAYLDKEDTWDRLNSMVELELECLELDSSNYCSIPSSPLMTPHLPDCFEAQLLQMESLPEQQFHKLEFQEQDAGDLYLAIDSYIADQKGLESIPRAVATRPFPS